MRLFMMAVAGGAVAWVYLEALGATVFGRWSARMSLLLAIVIFIGSTAAMLGALYGIAHGRVDAIIAELAGFVLIRALLSERTVGGWQADEDEDFSPSTAGVPLGTHPADLV